MEKEIPLVVAEVNPEQLKNIEMLSQILIVQRFKWFSSKTVT